MNFLKGKVSNMNKEKSILSATLAELNPELFFNPVFQNYYLKLFSDVNFENGVRGFHTPTSHSFCGDHSKAKIEYNPEGTFTISYVDYVKKSGRTLEIQKKENGSVLFKTRYVFPSEGLFYHMTEEQMLQDDMIYPIDYQYIGFDEKAIDEQEYQKDWMYQVNFADKMKENGIVPKVEHVHGIKSELNQTVSHR